MNHSIVELHVKRQGSKVKLQAFGKTPRGNKYMVAERELKDDTTLSPRDEGQIAEKLAEIIVERDAKN